MKATCAPHLRSTAVDMPEFCLRPTWLAQYNTYNMDWFGIIMNGKNMCNVVVPQINFVLGISEISNVKAWKHLKIIDMTFFSVNKKLI